MNSPGTGEFSAQSASNAENVSIWWRHHEIVSGYRCLPGTRVPEFGLEFSFLATGEFLLLQFILSTTLPTYRCWWRPVFLFKHWERAKHSGVKTHITHVSMRSVLLTIFPISQRATILYVYVLLNGFCFDPGIAIPVLVSFMPLISRTWPGSSNHGGNIFIIMIHRLELGKGLNRYSGIDPISSDSVEMGLYSHLLANILPK